MIDPEGIVTTTWDNVRVKEHAGKVLGVLREKKAR